MLVDELGLGKDLPHTTYGLEELRGRLCSEVFDEGKGYGVEVLCVVLGVWQRSSTCSCSRLS